MKSCNLWGLGLTMGIGLFGGILADVFPSVALAPTDDQKLNVSTDLEGFDTLEAEAPPRFREEVEGFQSMDGELWTAEDIREIQSEWANLATRIRRILEKAKADPGYAEVLEIEKKAADTVGLNRFFPAYVGRHDRSSLVFLQRARKTQRSQLTALEAWTHQEVEATRERMGESLPLPDSIGGKPVRLPIWLTTNNGDFTTMSIIARNLDGCGLRARYSPRHRVVFGLLSRNHDFEGSARDDFRIALALSEMDPWLPESIESMRHAWVLEGVARLIAGMASDESGALSRLIYQDLNRFVNDREQHGCDAVELFGPEGVTLSCGMTQRVPESTRWRRAAAHALFFAWSEDPSSRSRLEEVWSMALANAETTVSWIESRATAREALEGAFDYAQRVLRERPAAVTEPEIITQVSPSETLDPIESDLSAPSSSDRGAWISYLALVADGRMTYARDFAQARGWSEETRRCDDFVAYLARLDQAVKQERPKLRVSFEGQKWRLPLLGFEGDLINLQQEEQSIRVPLKAVQPSELTKLSKNIGLDDDASLACLSFWTGVCGKGEQAAKIAQKGGARSAAAVDSLERWETLIPEVKTYLEVDEVLRENDDSLLKAAAKLAKRSKDSEAFAQRRQGLRESLVERLDGVTPRRRAFLNQVYPRLVWDENSLKARYESSFDSHEDFKEYFLPEGDQLMERLGLSRPAAFRTRSFFVREGFLVLNDKSFGSFSFVAPLSAPIHVSLSRTSFIDADTKSLSVKGAPDLVVGVGDLEGGRYLASRGSGALFQFGAEGVVQRMISPEGVEPLDSLNQMIPLSLQYDGVDLSLSAQAKPTASLKLKTPIDGKVSFYVSGVYETRIDDMVIEGTLEPERLDELRRLWIESQVDRALGMQ